MDRPDRDPRGLGMPAGRRRCPRCGGWVAREPPLPPDFGRDWYCLTCGWREPEAGVDDMTKP
jgi:hypothetical protein